MKKPKKQAFIDFCKTFFNQQGIGKGLEEVKVEDGETYAYTFTFTVAKQFIRESDPEVSKLLEDFRCAQAYSSPTGEDGEVKTSMDGK